MTIIFIIIALAVGTGTGYFFGYDHGWEKRGRTFIMNNNLRDFHSAKEISGMSKQATSTFEVKKWDEKPFNEIEGGLKLTRVSVTKSFEGDIRGESFLEYLMMYRDDGTASFVGLERVVGNLSGKQGSFVLHHNGTYEGGTAKATYFVVPGSGTG